MPAILGVSCSTGLEAKSPWVGFATTLGSELINYHGSLVGLEGEFGGRIGGK